MNNVESETLNSARILVGKLAHLARLVYAREIDPPTLREAVMQTYDAACAHLAELEIPDNWKVRHE